MDETQGNGDMASKSTIANEPTHPRTSPEKAKTPRPEKKKQKVRAVLFSSVVVPPPTVVLRPLLRSPLEAHLPPGLVGRGGPSSVYLSTLSLGGDARIE